MVPPIHRVGVVNETTMEGAMEYEKKKWEMGGLGGCWQKRGAGRELEGVGHLNKTMKGVELVGLWTVNHHRQGWRGFLYISTLRGKRWLTFWYFLSYCLWQRDDFGAERKIGQL